MLSRCWDAVDYAGHYTQHKELIEQLWAGLDI